jgi:CheY-like chemotaxis protein/MinD-like ATPase involved in chromosome partitioning or flagellar assembly
VDDALVIRSIISKVLARDYDVVGDCGNGVDAIALAEKLQPDIILMDVTMPAMDGIEATGRILERFPNIAIVILSAVGNDRSIYAGLAAGARDYLVKPVKSRDILEVLGRLSRQLSERVAGQEAQQGISGTGLWSFCGPAGGGDGRTTLVLSVANELLAMGRRVVLLDADPIFGDMGFCLRLGGEEDVFGGLLKGEAVDVQRLLKHSSGLLLAGRSARGRPNLEVTSEELLGLAQGLKVVADHVLVDLPGGLPEGLLPILDDSRYIFPVSCDRPSRLKNLETMLDLLHQCGFAAPRMWPLLTRSTRKMETLGVHEFFPEDCAATELALREAMPVSRVAPRSTYTQRVREFLGHLLKVPVDAPKPGLLGGLFKRLRGS